MNKKFSNIFNSRFDDWQIFFDLHSNDHVCFININKNSLFNNLKKTHNSIIINRIDHFYKLKEYINEFDKIIITDFISYKKLSINYQKMVNKSLKKEGVIILFDKKKLHKDITRRQSSS